MFTKKILLTALLAAGMIGAVATPLSSVAQVEVQLNFAPPAARYEVVPPQRSGHVWSPGHWQWRGNTHVWVAGNWQQSRPGYVYYAPTWVERNGRWHYQNSRWDRDGDGIPNSQDRSPDGPRSRDKDHDGVPDRRDNYPNNPNYR